MHIFRRYLFGLLSIIIIHSCNNKPNKENNNPVDLKVMSFNIWLGGGSSTTATADVFVKSEADIIGVQESSRDGKNIAAHLADSLGWYSYIFAESQTIITKYPIVDTTANKHGVKIKIDEKHFVWMFNIHLIHCPYEPYQLNGIEYCEGPILHTAEEAIASVTASRGADVNSNLTDILEAKKEGYPIFLTGDFNEPSCLDWTDRATKARLCKLPVAWPSTKAFMDKANMKDSYRTIYPDEVKNPGHTWTNRPTEREVLDRIDFVFYTGDNLKVIKSEIIGENSAMSDLKIENYPSDHRAIMSTFTLE